MATTEELAVQLTAARARIDAAQKSGDDAAEFQAVADEEAAEEALLEAHKRVRKLAGKRLERAAKADAAGRYQVAFYDVASKLPQLDASAFPGGGLLVLRSADVGPRKRHEAAMVDGSGIDAADANISLICECTVAPTFKVGDPAAYGYRAWWENEGRGLIGLVALEISRLGGFQLEAFKRATK